MMADLDSMLRQLPRITGFLLAFGAAQALAADPVLPPASDLGQTEIRWEKVGNRLLGRAEGGECALVGDVPAVVGEWTGDVLVGTLRVCQKGPGCHERAMPLFAFFNSEDGTLTADVPLDAGCTSPWVTDGRVTLRPHTDGPTSSSAVAEALRAAREAGAGHAKSHLELGSAYLRKRNGRQALIEFQRALGAGEDAFTAYLGRGQAQALLDRPDRASKDYRHALAIKPDPDAFFNLACAQSRLQAEDDALESLKRAVAYGFSDRVKLMREPDLAPVRALPGFAQVMVALRGKSGR
jgi:tetratricopeptide (TPR) repeat protein